MKGDSLTVFGRTLPGEHVAKLLNQSRLGISEIFYQRGPVPGVLSVMFSWAMITFVLGLPFVLAGSSLGAVALISAGYGFVCGIGTLCWWWQYRLAAGEGEPQGAQRFRLAGWNNLLIMTLVAPMAFASIPLALTTNLVWGSLWTGVALGMVGAGFWLLPAILRRVVHADPEPPGRAAMAAALGVGVISVVTAFFPGSGLALVHLLLNVLSLLLLPLLPYMGVTVWIFLRAARRLEQAAQASAPAPTAVERRYDAAADHQSDPR